MTKLPDYYVQVFCPVDAANWLPQRRKRQILFGTRKPFNILAPVTVKNKPRLKDILEKDPIVEMPDYVLSRINGKYRDKPIIVDPEQSSALAPTCVAHYAKDLGTRLVKDQKSNMDYVRSPFANMHGYKGFQMTFISKINDLHINLLAMLFLCKWENGWEILQ